MIQNSRCFPLALIFLLPPLLLQGQNTEPSVFRGSEAYVYSSVHFPDRSDFNADWAREGLPKISGPLVELGMGGGAFLNRFYLGGSGGFHFGGQTDHRDHSVNRFGGGGMFRLGYTLIHNQKTALYPTIGIGGGGASFTLTEAADAQSPHPHFADGSEISFHMGYMVLDFGLNSDLFTSLAFGKNKFLVGLSAGYRLHPLNSQWESDDADFDPPTSPGLDGFYGRLKIGIAFL